MSAGERRGALRAWRTQRPWVGSRESHGSRAGRGVLVIFASLLFSACPAMPPAAIQGRLMAPEDHDLEGTLVILCFVREGRCEPEADESRYVIIDGRGSVAAFEAGDLAPGEYLLTAILDRNGNAEVDAGDLFGRFGGDSPRVVIAPAHDVEIALAPLEGDSPPPLAGAPQPVTPPAPSAATPRPSARQPLHGIYSHVQVISWVTGGGIGNDHDVFFPDGRFRRGYPPEGLQDFDWSVECRPDVLGGATCGTYEVRGGTAVLRFTDGRFDEREVAPEGEPGIGLRRLDRLTGLRPAGRYEVVDLTVSEDSPRRIVTLELSPDGRFRERNLLAYVHWASSRDQAARSRVAVPGGVGTYSIRENTLELRYDRGPTVRLGVHVPYGKTARPEPEEICFAQYCFPRVGTASSR